MRPEFNQPETGYQNFFESWLRIAANINQSGRPAVIFGVSFGVPQNLENLVERRYFSEVRYLGLVCDDRDLENRLRNRPNWRESTDNFIKRQIEFNRWLKSEGSKWVPPVELINTSNVSLDETVEQVLNWIEVNQHG